MDIPFSWDLFPREHFFNRYIDTVALWHVVPFCWNQVLQLGPSNSYKTGTKISLNGPQEISALTVTATPLSLPKKYPNNSACWYCSTYKDLRTVERMLASWSAVRPDWAILLVDMTVDMKVGFVTKHLHGKKWRNAPTVDMQSWRWAPSFGF